MHESRRQHSSEYIPKVKELLRSADLDLCPAPVFAFGIASVSLPIKTKWALKYWAEPDRPIVLRGRDGLLAAADDPTAYRVEEPAVPPDVWEEDEPRREGVPEPPAHDSADEKVSAETIPIDALTVEVLRTFEKHFPVPQMNVTIQVETNRSKQTIGNVVRELLARGWIARPHGQRRGATLTTAGRQVLSGIP